MKWSRIYMFSQVDDEKYTIVRLYYENSTNRKLVHQFHTVRS